MIKNVFKGLVASAVFAVGVAANAADITGAGATFPYPVYAKWAEAYKQKTDVGLNYQAIGSSGGLRQIVAKTVTFGASDAPADAKFLDENGLVQFPAIIGGTVPVFNLDGFKPGELRMTGEVLAEIYLGTITNWNDPKIAQLNPGKKLPNQSITVVARADGSGTTYNFTDYLTSVSKQWADQIGTDKSINWPAASTVGGKGNAGVAANVDRLKGAIGYVEYAYVMENKMRYLELQNKDGNFVAPEQEAFAAGADWFSVPGMGLSIVNQPGAKAWPISTASFILMYKQPADKANSAEALKFFTWAFEDGQKLASSLDYVPLPEKLVKDIETKVWTQINLK
jgi:phosphate transport system substrate-binding protein